MPFCAKDMKTACCYYLSLLLIAFILNLLINLLFLSCIQRLFRVFFKYPLYHEIRIAAKKNVRAPAGHVCRNSYCPFAAGLGDNFSDRSWFINPMKDGKSFVSDFYTSKITGALCITVSAPVRSQTDEIAGVFGVDIRFEDLVRTE